MPELPEVETVRRRIAPALEGRRLDEVEIEDARLTRPHDPVEVAAELRGERVSEVDRRGKYLIVRFDSGRALLIHLRMTGSLRADALEGDAHRRALLTLDDGSRVAYKDVRRFGTWLLLEPDEVEPVPRASAWARSRCSSASRRGACASGSPAAGHRSRRRCSTSATLAGLGNIYVDEALWYAKLNPLREAGHARRPEARRLHAAIRKALELGIARQGSTLSDYRLPDGSSGTMQQEFRAYGRTDEPCDRCGTTLVKTRVGGRSTWYCPSCQPL